MPWTGNACCASLCDSNELTSFLSFADYNFWTLRLEKDFLRTLFCYIITVHERSHWVCELGPSARSLNTRKQRFANWT
jgi:hypothetical protein